jgi:hypothetical protein
MRALLAILAVVVLSLVVARGAGQSRLSSAPMRAEQVKPGLYVIRGPFDPCAPGGCNGRNTDDGLLHEPGDVAVRVTSEGAIVVDDKFVQNVPDVLSRVKSVTTQPIRYLLNSHHHADHIGGNGAVMDLGIEIIAHRNIRENIIRNNSRAAALTFTDEGRHPPGRRRCGCFTSAMAPTATGDLPRSPHRSRRPDRRHAGHRLRQRWERARVRDHTREIMALTRHRHRATTRPRQRRRAGVSKLKTMNDRMRDGAQEGADGE